MSKFKRNMKFKREYESENENRNFNLKFIKKNKIEI